MENQKHTPEPWAYEYSHIQMDRDDTVEMYSVFRKDDPKKWRMFYCKKEDAARIVACVNYCKGTPNEELEAGSLEQLKAERDAFAKALRDYIDASKSHIPVHSKAAFAQLAAVKLLEKTGGSHE